MWSACNLAGKGRKEAVMEFMKLERQHTKAALAATISPFFMSLLYPLKPWREWCVKVDHTTGCASTTLFKQWCGFFYVPQEQISVTAVRRDLRFFVLIRED